MCSLAIYTVVNTGLTKKLMLQCTWYVSGGTYLTKTTDNSKLRWYENFKVDRRNLEYKDELEGCLILHLPHEIM